MSNHTGYIAALRALADWLEENPLPPYTDIWLESSSGLPEDLNIWVPRGAESASLSVREALGGDWVDRNGNGTYYRTEPLFGFMDVAVR